MQFHAQYRDVQNDQWGKSHFNWTLDNGTNYHILRTGCYPYMKYHCTKRPYQDLKLDDNFMKFIKIINLGKNVFISILFYPILQRFMHEISRISLIDLAFK